MAFFVEDYRLRQVKECPPLIARRPDCSEKISANRTPTATPKRAPPSV
jgi:hypothetical protein